MLLHLDFALNERWCHYTYSRYKEVTEVVFSCVIVTVTYRVESSQGRKRPGKRHGTSFSTHKKGPESSGDVRYMCNENELIFENVQCNRSH